MTNKDIRFAPERPARIGSRCWVDDPTYGAAFERKNALCVTTPCVGVHPKEAQGLARRSDINLTMNRAGHRVIADLAAALDTLPDLTKRPERRQQRATGTDGRSLVPGLALSLPKRRSSKASPLSSSGTEVADDRDEGVVSNPDKQRVSSHLSHQVTPCGTCNDPTRRSGRVAEGDGLENR